MAKSSDEHWRVKPVYATYSFWILLAVMVSLIFFMIDLYVKVYKLGFVLEYYWNATMTNTTWYQIMRQAHPIVDEFLPFK